MATEDNLVLADESSFHDMFDHQDLDNLDELFDFSQYDASFLGTWDPLELEGGANNHQEQLALPVYDVDHVSFDLENNGATTEETDRQVIDPAALSSAEALPNPSFINGTNPTPTVLPQFANAPLQDSITDIDDFFTVPSTSNEFIGFGDGWPQPLNDAFTNFRIHGGNTTNATYMTPTAIFSPSIFDLNSSTQTYTGQLPLQRFTELTDESPTMDDTGDSQEPQVLLQQSRTEIQFRRTDETMVSTLPKKRYFSSSDLTMIERAANLRNWNTGIIRSEGLGI